MNRHRLQDSPSGAHRALASRLTHWVASGATLGCLAASARAQSPGTITVRLETAAGPIVLAIDSLHAPKTAGNFLHYVDAGAYNGGRFYRTVTPDNQQADPVRIAVIQGGLAAGGAVHRLPPVPLERTNATGLHHRDGTISMARRDPDSATSEFFICVGDQPALDFGGGRHPDKQGFAAFGHVVSGMDAVRHIWHSPANGQTLDPEIRITRATRSK